jgi:hypothetical protein
LPIFSAVIPPLEYEFREERIIARNVKIKGRVFMIGKLLIKVSHIGSS